MVGDSPPEPLDNGILETYTLDVGQADARLVITETGALVLVDADIDDVGPKLDQVLDGRAGRQMAGDTTTIDLFVATHLDYDHVNGLSSLHGGYTIDEAAQPSNSRFEITNPQTGEPKEGVKQPVVSDFATNLDRLGVDTISQVAVGESPIIDVETDVQVLAPPTDDHTVEVTRASTGATVSLPPERPNENGAVYKLEGERSALFMGDVQDKSDHYAESWLIQEHDDPASDVDLSADVLFVAHHGSANATSEEFLDRVEPDLAVISSDFAQRHDHPHDEVLKNVHEHDVSVLWTAGHGTTRVDLDETLATERTTDLVTTNAADLAALKHHCREHDVVPEEIETLAPGHLPEETPDWVVESAPIVAQTPEEIVDAAITNADTIEETRQTLAATPDAQDQLRETVQADRAEHVTTDADVERNRGAFFNAKEAERAYQRLPLHTRVRANLPNRFGGIDHPLEDVPATAEMDSLRKFDAVPKAVRKPTAAEQRKRNKIVTRYLQDAERAADTAVEAAETSQEVCQTLRETDGAHEDFLYAIDTPNAHEANKPDQNLDDLLNRAKQQERTTERTHDQDIGLGL